jgi:hypothetical protein
MPIEIRELVIRAQVDPSEGHACGSSPSPTSEQGRQPSQDDLIQTCIREVLRILEQKRER